MPTRERILAIRLMEKICRDRAYAEKAGIEGKLLRIQEQSRTNRKE